MRRAHTLVADPGWEFDDPLPGPKRGAAKHYETMGLLDICRFKLPPLADDCRLFLWRVAAMQEEAILVMRAWGFEIKAELVWVKQTVNGKIHFGMGRTVRNSHETCLIGVRGKPDVLNHSVRSVFFAPVGEHSEKPETFYQIVEKLSPGPYTELFARQKRPGWTCLGDGVKEAPGGE